MKEQNEQYECLGSQIFKIFGVNISNKEDAIESIDFLVEYCASILGILFAGNIVELLFGHIPFFGIIPILFFGFLTFCFKKWKSRIATTIFFVILLLLSLSAISLILNNEFKGIWKYEILFMIPLLIVSWKMLRSSFLIHKK